MSLIIEMRGLALEGLTILKEEAKEKYFACRAQIEQELLFLQEDRDRGGSYLQELMAISVAVRDEYVAAVTELQEALL